MSTDLGGNPRLADDANVPDTGSGMPPIVDMGAYERQGNSVAWGTINVPGDFNSIQEAINEAYTGDQVIVAPGTYNENINFNGKGIRLRSSNPNDPNIVATTIIDGTAYFQYHVVQCASYEDANTILEGFIITGGNARGSYPTEMSGGGIYCENSSPTVTNCILSGNSASGYYSSGGGMYCENSSPTVTNCIFSENTCSKNGGGMSNAAASSPTVTNCNFAYNTADANGGGMYNEGGSPTVTDCNFIGNSAKTGGGGMFNNGSSPTVTNCGFYVNSADDKGGGIYNDCNSDPNVANCTFIRNSAVDDGAGMYNYSSSPTVTNCIFSYNIADCNGGGMYDSNSDPNVTNCTFSRNSATVIGGGMFNFQSSPTVTNCIFWGDEPNEIFDEAGSSSTVTHSDVDGGTGQSWFGTGCIDADPLFVDSAHNDLRLRDCSPCSDAGNNAAAPPDTTDLDGDDDTNEPIPFDHDGYPRFVDDANVADTGSGTPPIVDMGACERQMDTPGFKVRNITRGMNYCSIQDAIEDADDGDEIEAIPTTYRESINFNGMAITLRSTDPNDPNIVAATVIDGTGDYHVVQCVNGEDANTILAGFTITGGNANGPIWPDDKCGGGMYNYYSSPTVTNCILWGDTPDEIYGGSPIVSYSNVAGGYSGTGNINADPLFVDAAALNLRLSLYSPCIDAGNNGAAYLPDTDLAGSKRIEDGDWDGTFVVDMGALELKAAYEITVLTYNTHLFEDTTVAFWSPQNYHEDTTRRISIASKVEESGADIVALQEVWDWGNQLWFVFQLKDTYPYWLVYNSERWSYLGDTLGNGLVLLSKFPLSDVGFRRFPTYTYTAVPADNDYWANKGVLTATVDTGFEPVRVGISHALTGGDDQKSRWSASYKGTNITTFDVNGQPCIFALKSEAWWFPYDDYDEAYLTRIYDYSDYNEQDPNESTYGAGWEDSPCGYCSNCGNRQWDSDYLAVVSFELDGYPYLFGLKSEYDQAYITRINEDPFLCWQDYGPYSTPWGTDYRSTTITSFQLNGEPYIFGQKSTGNQARIARIVNPSQGFDDLGLFTCGSQYSAVVSFELNGHPYLFGLTSDYSQACISRINDNPATGWTDVYDGPWDRYYVPTAITSFQLNGHPYIFGLESNDNQAWITRINDDPSTGCTDVYHGAWNNDYVAIKSFEMNGHPYLFALKNCCQEYLDMCGDWRPGEAYLTRINDDPNTGWQDVYQMEDMKIIRDRTVGEEDMPAIMMGDFNVHRSKYGVMDNIFEKEGAVDAYIQVHGTGAGGETIDLGKNKLAQKFSPLKDPCDLSEGNFDRIDYVYVQSSGTGFDLVPTEAHVIRDWKYDDIWCSIPDMDLSDHYPLTVKFQIRRSADFNDDSKIDFNDLAMLVSGWLAEPGDLLWDVKYNLNLPPDEVINMLDFAVFAEGWLVGK